MFITSRLRAKFIPFNPLRSPLAFYLHFFAVQLSDQLIWLFVLALPVSVIAWTLTHEEIFREPRDFCMRKSKDCKRILYRKFFYVWTCEYCFSFYATALVLFITHYKLLFSDWRGYFVSGLSLVWIANIYMSLFFLLRTGIKKEGMEIKKDEKVLEELK